MRSFRTWLHVQTTISLFINSYNYVKMQTDKSCSLNRIIRRGLLRLKQSFMEPDRIGTLLLPVLFSDWDGIRI